MVMFRKRSLEEYDDDYKPLSKRLHSMYLKDGPITGENNLADTNAYGVSIINLLANHKYSMTHFKKHLLAYGLC